MTGVLLAGGQGRRIGGAKHRALLAGQPLLVHALTRLRPHVSELMVAGSDPWIDDWLAKGERRIGDALPDCGPLGGLLAGLEAASNDRCLVLAVDLPLVSDPLIEALGQSFAMFVAPTAGGRLQPLASLVQRQLAPSLRDYLQRGNRRVMGWLEELGERVERLEWPAEELANLNEPSDLKAVQDRGR